MSPEDQEQQKPEYEFDINAMQLTNKLNDVHQEGNFLVGVTETGVRFRQRIKPGQILKQINGELKLVPLEISAG